MVFSYYTDNEKLKDGLRRFLKENDICYSVSGCGEGWNFTIIATPEQAENANKFLDEWEESV